MTDITEQRIFFTVMLWLIGGTWAWWYQTEGHYLNKRRRL